jgi:ElaB/YqjD/DUF883 family membrane-anchored ribosome-binding protein
MGQGPDEMSASTPTHAILESVPRAIPAEPERIPDAGEDTEQIRVRIEQTRDDMSETIDAIQERLSPRHLVEQAKDTVREATIGKVKAMADNVSDTASGLADSTMEAASEMADRVKQNPWPAAMIGIGAAWLLLRNGGSSGGSRQYDEARPGGGEWKTAPYRSDYQPGGSLAGIVRQNPVPAVLAGVGLGLLAMKAGQRSGYSRSASGARDWRRPSGDYRAERSGQYGATTNSREGADPVQATYNRAKEAVSGVAGRAQEVVSDTFDRTQERVAQLTNQARYQGEDLLNRNPLVLGAVALAVGAAVGLSVPETEPENRMMGDARETLVGRAQEAAQSAVEKVKDVAAEAANTLGK